MKQLSHFRQGVRIRVHRLHRQQRSGLRQPFGRLSSKSGAAGQGFRGGQHDKYFSGLNLLGRGKFSSQGNFQLSCLHHLPGIGESQGSTGFQGAAGEFTKSHGGIFLVVPNLVYQAFGFPLVRILGGKKLQQRQQLFHPGSLQGAAGDDRKPTSLGKQFPSSDSPKAGILLPG